MQIQIKIESIKKYINVVQNLIYVLFQSQINKSEEMAEEFRKKISNKIDMKEVNVVNWLYNSHITKNQWIKAEREKLEENSIKEWTFKPAINKRVNDTEVKSTLKQRTNDKFNDLYQKAKRDKVKRNKGLKSELEFEELKEWTFMPNISPDKPKNKASNNSINDALSSLNPHDSNQGSNPEVTSAYKPFDTNDMDYVNKKIEEIKNSHIDMDHRYENNEYSPDEDYSGSKVSLISPVRINNALSIQNRLTSETPKTEELEEEMRDQVLDYQNPVFNNVKTIETQEYDNQGILFIFYL